MPKTKLREKKHQLKGPLVLKNDIIIEALCKNVFCLVNTYVDIVAYSFISSLGQYILYPRQ